MEEQDIKNAIARIDNAIAQICIPRADHIKLSGDLVLLQASMQRLFELEAKENERTDQRTDDD